MSLLLNSRPLLLIETKLHTCKIENLFWFYISMLMCIGIIVDTLPEQLDFSGAWYTFFVTLIRSMNMKINDVLLQVTDRLFWVANWASFAFSFLTITASSSHSFGSPVF